MLNQYQAFQKTTSKQDWDLNYLGVGLGGEVGELLNEIKKMYRDDNSQINKDRLEKIVKEMGDVMWYLTGIANKLDINLETVLETNIEKLNKLKAND